MNPEHYLGRRIHAMTRDISIAFYELLMFLSAISEKLLTYVA
jgi:hypothetical protein